MTEKCDALTFGMYVITTTLKGRLYGTTCCWATQISSDEILLCLGKQSTTRTAILDSRVFGVSVLTVEQKSLALHFGERHSAEVDKFDAVQTVTGELGVPLLPDSLKTIECEVKKDTFPEHDELMLGRIVHFTKGSTKNEPLLLCHIDKLG